jgi:hypothetical protein
MRGSSWCVVPLATMLIVISTSAQKPAQLDRIVVTVQEKQCPTTDTQEARALWRAMASHYAPAITLLPRTGQVSRDGGYAQGSVLTEDLGSLRSAEEAALANGGVRNARRGVVLAGPVSMAARSRFDRHEYAARVPADEPRLLYQPVYLNWYYSRIDENFIDDLIDSTFEARYNFSASVVPGGTKLVFCGREHSKPWIEGTMDLTRDTLLAHVALRYITPRPHEDAAAEVWLDLDAAKGNTAHYLWPERSIFYRRSSEQNVWFQEAWVNMITCLWHEQADARAGRAPDLASRKQGCIVQDGR